MSDVYEMNGSVLVQGRPGVLSTDGKNWCYTITFLANCSSPICDLSITTRDKGSVLVPEFLALNPDINPQDPEDPSVESGIGIETGSFNPAGEYVPGAPLSWTRQPIDGTAPDPKKSADEIKLKFSPCIPKGAALRVQLCFDEELDENDEINFVPSLANGSSVGGGDVTPTTALSNTDLLRLLGQIAGAAVPLFGRRMSNDVKRVLLAQYFTQNPRLARVARDLAPPSLEDDLRRGGTAAVLARIPLPAIVDGIGVERLAREIGVDSLVTLVGAGRLAQAARATGLASELKKLL